MNQQIVDYLQKNKEGYTQESLVQQLKNAGHDDAKIQEAVNFVYNNVQSSDAQNSQNTSNNNVHYAGFWIRWVAILIDGLVMLIPAVIILVIVGMVSAQLIPALSMGGARWIGYIGAFIIALLYFAIMTDKYQATLGKMAVGIKVCDADTLDKAKSGDIWKREFINRIFLNTPIPLLTLAELVVAFTERKQGLHDMAAKTVVVYKDPNKKVSGGVIAVIVIVVGLVFVAIIGILSSIVLVSLNSARNTAQEASVKSSISSTVPAAIICMDKGQNITPPVVGAPICKDSNGTWPKLAETGEWGKLIDGDVSDGNFEYTAIYSDGEMQVSCTERGCDFPDKSY